MGKKLTAKTKLKNPNKKPQQNQQKKQNNQQDKPTSKNKLIQERMNQHGKGIFIKDPNQLLSKNTVDGYTVTEKTQLIEEISNFVITEPEFYVNHLQTLLYLMQSDSMLVMKLSCFSLTQIFKDITPQYQINYKQHLERLKQSIKKEERAVLTFEAKLYENYEKFIEALFTLVKAKAPGQKKNQQKKQKKQEQEQEQELTPLQKQFQSLNQMGLKCLAELLSTLYHFNNINDVASKIVYSYLSEDKEIRELCFEKIAEILSDPNHSLYELKKHILKDLAKILKARPEKDTPDDFIDLVNKIEIDTAHLKKNYEADEKNKKLDAKKRKKQYYLDLERAKKEGKKVKTDKDKYVPGKKQKNMNEDDKQALKHMKKEMREELKEGEGELTPQQIVRHNSDILEKIFYIYFKVIKSEEISKFFNSAMNGILKHVHLINVELIQALVNNLYVCASALRTQCHKQKNLQNLEKRLACLFTVEDIIQGPGQAIEIDDKDAQMHFFHIIIDINKFSKKLEEELEKRNQILLLRLLEKMFIRKRQFNYDTCASFIKHLLEVSTKLTAQSQLPTLATILFIVKQMLKKYPKIQRMLDEENYGYGLDMYNQKIEDPQSTNAINTTIHIELKQIIENISNQDIKTMANRILNNEPLLPSISSLRPMEFYQKLNQSAQ